MADKYSTIQQHQPLRIPNGWNGQEKQLIVQLDEIFDDIYRRFGRLKVSDFGSQLQDLCLVKDEDGKYVSVQSSIDGIETDIHDQLGNYYTKSETVSQISASIGNALGDYSTTEQMADAISAAVSDCYGNVSKITIDTVGIKLETDKILDITSGCELRIRSDANIAIYSGGSIGIASGGALTINSGATFSVNTTNFFVDANYAYFKGGGEIQSGRSLANNGTINLNASSTMNLQSGADFYINSGGNMTIKSGGNLKVNTGGSMEFYSGGTMDFKSGSTLKFTASGNSKVEISDAGIDIVSGKYVKIASGTSGYWKYDDYGQTFFDTSDAAELQFGNYANARTGLKAGMFVGKGVTVYSNVDSNAVLFKARHPNTNAYKTVALTISDYGDYDSFSPLVDESVNLGVPSYAWGDCFVHYAKILGASRSGSPALYVAANTNSWLYGTVYYDTLIQGSSKDIKHDIQPMPSFGSKIDQLKTVSFVYDNDKNENRRYGLIYEDTLPVFPEICTKDESSKAVNYIELIPMLVKEIQELRLRMAAVEGS